MKIVFRFLFIVVLLAFLSLPADAARNGSGTMSVPYPNFTSGSTISSSQMNLNFSNVVSEITNSVPRDGQAAPTANLPMGGFKFTGLGTGSANGDSLTLGQAQNNAFTWCGTVGGTKNTLTCSPTPAVTAYAAGQKFRFISGAAQSDSTVTFALSALTTAAMQINGSALSAFLYIEPSKLYEATYDGSAFQLTKIGYPSYLALTTTGTPPLTGAYSPSINALTLTTSGTAAISISNAQQITLNALTTTGALWVNGGIISSNYPTATIQALTTTGTYTPNSHLVYALIRCVGAGGGGGGTAIDTSGHANTGGGGGSGSVCEKMASASAIGASQSVGIGTGGAGGIGNSTGGSGGDTSFGSLCVGKGGTGGGGAADTAAGAGGAGGVAGTGDTTYIGTAGQPGVGLLGNLGSVLSGGAGGSSPFFGGGASGATANSGAATTNGNAATTSTGGGGSGASGFSTSGAGNGGAGANGKCVVYEYNYQ